MRGSHAIVIVPDGSLQTRGVSVSQTTVVTDIQVEVAVIVNIGKRRRGRPVAVATKSRGRGHVFERRIASVVIKGVRAPAGHKEVGMSVVVVISYGNTVPVPSWKRLDFRPGRVIIKSAIAPVPKQPIAGVRPCGAGGNGPPCTA